MKNLPIRAATGGILVPTLVFSAMLLGLASLAGFSQEPVQEPSIEPPSAIVDGSSKRQLPADRLRRIRIGEALPDFLLTTANGEEIESKAYHDRALVLVYLSAEQRNSERAATDATRVIKKFDDEDVDLLFVTADFGHEPYFQTLFEEAHISAPLGFDGGHSLYSSLGLIVFPSTLIVGKDGKLDHVILTRRSDYSHMLDAFVGHTLGLLSDASLEQRIVAPSMTRSSPKTMAQRHREAARLLRDNELYRGAEEELKMAVELDPQSNPIRIDLADLLVAIRRYEEAESLLDTILAVDADHRGARLLLGITRYHQDRPEEAEVILLEALVMNPDPEQTHYYLGRIYQDRGDLEKAAQHYRDACERLLHN